MTTPHLFRSCTLICAMFGFAAMVATADAQITGFTSTSISTSADDFLLDLDGGTVGQGTAASPGATVLDLTAGNTLQLTDWALFNFEPPNDTVGDTLVDPYAEGSANVIFDTFIQGDSDNGQVSSNAGSNGWWDTIVGGVVNDGDSAMRAARVDGSIDVSGLGSGVVYFFSASFENTDRVQARELGGDYADNSLVDDPSGPGGWVRALSFGPTTSTLEWQYRNSDTDGSPGSRARFAGIAVFSAVPEPCSAVFIAFGGVILSTFRRRIT